MSKALQIATHITTWTSFVLAIATCVVRCYCCRNIKRSWKADDFMSLVVGVFLLGALGLWQRAFALGCVSPKSNTCNYFDPSGDVLTWLFVTSIIYDAVLHFIIRMAFFTFYLRFSARSKFRFWIGMGFGMDGILLVFNVLIIVFRCKPVTAAFRPSELMTAQCMDAGFALFVPAVMNNLLNLYVLIMPIPIFYFIQLPARRKLYICCTYSTGGAAVTLGFLRMHALHVLNTTTKTAEAVGEMMIMGALGMSLAAIAHNLPAMRVFWSHISKSRSETKRTSFRPYGVKSKNKGPLTSTIGVYSTVYGDGSCSGPMPPAMSEMNLVDRPLPVLPNGGISPRYPAVNYDFGMHPRAPPSVV